jgi:thioester reductase-like protein
MANVYEFYKDSTLLITGGTGFMGKVLVEKLLRCFEVKKIYLLVRTKKGENAKTRLDKLAKASVRFLLWEWDITGETLMVPGILTNFFHGFFFKFEVEI